MQKIGKYGKQISKKILMKIPFLKNYIQNHDHLVKAYSERYKEIGFPPGHYYSPIPSLDEINENKNAIFQNEDITDIDLRVEEQFQLLQALKVYYSSVPYNFSEQINYNKAKNVSKKTLPASRYFIKDAWYRYSDVIFLTAVMRHFKPKKIIEIGSGHSSAVMLDTDENFFNSSIDFTFIEPFPEERLFKVLTENDRQRVRVIKNKIQAVDIGVFVSLQENDIVFIDTTHVSKVGSDVNHIFFKVLPVLKPGVLIHFHDIFYPFELPQNWIFEKKWFWNETYILRAFLMNNHAYEVLLFNSLLHKKYRHWFENEMPDCLIGSKETGSIWIRKKS